MVVGGQKSEHRHQIDLNVALNWQVRVLLRLYQAILFYVSISKYTTPSGKRGQDMVTRLEESHHRCQVGER